MIDLKSLAGARYKITLDESDADSSPRSDRPWMYRIPAKFGHIFVQGHEQLGVYCRSNRKRPELLAAPGLKVIQNGDREMNATFPTDQLDAVCAIIHAKRRRVLSPERRAALAVIAAKGMRTIREGRSNDSQAAPGRDGEGSDVESYQHVALD